MKRLYSEIIPSWSVKYCEINCLAFISYACVMNAGCMTLIKGVIYNLVLDVGLCLIKKLH